jgi:N-formylglutamate amidohydrolase
MDITRNIILHIPHSSKYVPYYEGFISDEETIKSEINHLTDWFTDELFDLPYPKIITPFSRIFCDVERFEDDELEIMSLYGMGMCYTQTDKGVMMRTITPELKLKIKSEYYSRHHQQLEQLTTETLAKSGQALIIDCHSYPDLPLNRDLNKEIPRPDFCIGTDNFHTPPELIRKSSDFLSDNGFTVKLNNPYSGSIIPLKYYQQNKNVHGIMIEINRKLYMDIINTQIVKTDNFENIKHLIKYLMPELLL